MNNSLDCRAVHLSNDVYNSIVVRNPSSLCRRSGSRVLSIFQLVVIQAVHASFDHIPRSLAQVRLLFGDELALLLLLSSSALLLHASFFGLRELRCFCFNLAILAAVLHLHVAFSIICDALVLKRWRRFQVRAELTLFLFLFLFFDFLQ